MKALSRSSQNLLVVAAIVLVGIVANAQLQFGFYRSLCPGTEFIVRNAVFAAVRDNRGLGAGLLRMHFHDCFVKGCDGSVLIDSTTGNTAEKDSRANNPSLRGFEVIDTIKAQLEARCPAVVSCADILAFAARDSVSALGGPFWLIRSGRRDGTVSTVSDVSGNLPSPSFNLQQLTQNFNAKGLTQDEMITLSGAHTIGQSHCGAFTRRLYSFNSSTSQDPALDSQYAKKLKDQCPQNNSDPSTVVPLDPLTPNFFDNSYFTNLLMGRGLFSSDEVLFTDVASVSTVQSNSANGFSWRQSFPQAMIKMSEVEVKTNQQGEIRRNCRVVNS